MPSRDPHKATTARAGERGVFVAVGFVEGGGTAVRDTETGVDCPDRMVTMTVMSW